MTLCWRRGYAGLLTRLLLLAPVFVLVAIALRITRKRRLLAHQAALFDEWREAQLARNCGAGFSLPSADSQEVGSALQIDARASSLWTAFSQSGNLVREAHPTELSAAGALTGGVPLVEEKPPVAAPAALLEHRIEEITDIPVLADTELELESMVEAFDDLVAIVADTMVKPADSPVRQTLLPMAESLVQQPILEIQVSPSVVESGAVLVASVFQDRVLNSAAPKPALQRGFAQAANQLRRVPQMNLLKRPVSDDNGSMSATVPSISPPRLTTSPPPTPSVPPSFAPAKVAEYNRTGMNFSLPMPRPKVHGTVIDFHCHLLAARHAKGWFESARHFGIDAFVTMCPLEEAMVLQRDWGDRLQFIAVPAWRETPRNWFDDFLNRVEMFHNLGSRIVKFHMAPGTMEMRKYRLDSPELKPIFREIRARKMAIMTHMGDPDTWYRGKYADTAKYGTRDDHYKMWEAALAEHPKEIPWIGAHMGGNPEDLPRLQRLLDTYSNLYLDCSATRWMVREISARREAAREFFIRNSGRIIFGSDQVSGDDRGFDFLASRFWCHRKLWETAYIGPSPIQDPDVPEDQQPTLHGLALPDDVLQKLYHDNAIKVLGMVGAGFGWG